MLEGRNFTIYTDHKPLVYAFTQKHEKCSPRQIRHLDWIGQFSTDIRHILGSLNVVADSLSRISEIEMPSPIDYKEFSQAQLSDEMFQLLKFLKVPGVDTKLFCDVSTGRCRPLLPKEFRRRSFETLHNLFHPGVKATVKLVGDFFLWPSYKEQVAEWTRCCVPCQRGKCNAIRIGLLSLWFLPIVDLILLFLELRSILPFKWDLASRRLVSTD
ncbi:hypothetical protein AVEN_268723-1 [Araneus ventricosus]|uniref:RNA-directed DNA polymerase n=1 Tax=Araneus ventricosus TaxID=182803 RepID=A0A4Y2HSI7_ARAVE|nr:hypothetical protein AVEN_268723-1 [Araneus ventricosus]